jgi:hypothetical protein
MTADIARITYDPTRQYRSVIYQQGRVTLEADNNEAALLAEEALRLETIDIIGPTGALGNGYAVSSGKGPGGVIINPGVFYLGGWRLQLDHAFAIPGQLARGAEAIRIGPFVIALLLTEQSVCAVEDQALREPALGGPDSAARMRLMQSFPQAGLTGNTCAIGATTIAGLLEADGVTIDPASLQLLSSARLLAGFIPAKPSTDSCTPTAAGGYLGADNQMVRVTVTDFNATAKTGTLLWGWNNASLLYRASATGAETLTLTNIPVDQEHAPQQTQMVEILRTELDLTDNNFIAEAEGFVTSLAQGYSFDTQTIVLSNPLPAEYQNNANPLFVRVWQASVPFNAGQVTPLDGVSGITVTITMAALPTNIAARPFWHFSVRPAMPNKIFPQRYADSPQPPDGPRQWITDLAVLETQGSGAKLLADCRIPFVPLTQQKTGGCCALVLGPEEIAGRGGLQAVVDSLTQPAVLSLRPGTYPLTAPLALARQHNGLTIEGCTGGVILEAVTAHLAAFRLGLVTITGANNITLRKLDFKVPPVPGTAAATGTALVTFAGIGIISAEALIIEGCAFALLATAIKASGGGCIMVTGGTTQVTIRRNRFSAARPGFLIAGVSALFNGNNGVSRLDQWEISGNVFTGLGAAVLAQAQLGLVRCTGNLVTESAAGFVFWEANLGSTGAFTHAALNDAASGKNAALAQAANATLRPDILISALTAAKPILDAVPAPAGQAPAGQAPATPPTLSEIAKKVLTEKMTRTGTEAYKTLGTATASQTSAQTPSAGAAPGGASPGGTAPASGEVPAATLANSGEVSATVPAANANASNFNTINEVSAAAEAYESALTPALRFDDNEITVTSTATDPAMGGIGVSLSLDEPGSVIVNGNRVVVPDASAIACGLLFPVSAVVTGNLFAQLAAAPKGSTAQFCMSLITTSPAIMVSANMTSFFELVLPPRARDLGVTTWEFLNTTG